MSCEFRGAGARGRGLRRQGAPPLLSPPPQPLTLAISKRRRAITAIGLRSTARGCRDHIRRASRACGSPSAPRRRRTTACARPGGRQTLSTRSEAGAFAVSSASGTLPMRGVAARSGLLGAQAASRGGAMKDRDRLEQLRALLARLERMPASAERDWMLGEVRARAVDVETGEKPAAMRARSADGVQPGIPAAPKASRIEATQTRPPAKPGRGPAPRPPAARATPASPTAGSPLAAAPRRADLESAVDLLQQGGELCLDDGAAPADGASRPWSGGLRG